MRERQYTHDAKRDCPRLRLREFRPNSKVLEMGSFRFSGGDFYKTFSIPFLLKRSPGNVKVAFHLS